MTTIASLRVALEADSSKLRKGLDKAKQSVARLAGATLAAGAGIGALVSKGLNSADALQKLSLRTGASVEALSVLEHAGALADVSLSGLERGFVNMNRAIGEANDGTAAQADAFKALGIPLEQLSRLKPEQQFGLIADALNRVESESERARLGNDIFGGQYRKLLPLLKGGSEGLRQAAEEASKLGVVLSTEAANGAAEANDAMARLQSSFTGITRTLSVQVAPDIANFFEALAEKLPAIIASIKAAFVGVGSVIGGVAAAIGAFFSGEFSQAADIVSSIPDQTSAAVQASLDASLAQRAPKTGLDFGGKGGEELRNLRGTNESQLEVLRKIERKVGAQVAVTG